MQFVDYLNNAALDLTPLSYNELTKTFYMSFNYAGEGKIYHVEEADLEALMHWLEFNDLQSPKNLSFRNIPLVFEYGHFEKGEIYYIVKYEKHRIYSYDQLSGSNDFKINAIRSEMRKARL